MFVAVVGIALAGAGYDVCDDIGSMVKAGLPNDVVLATVHEMKPRLNQDDLVCLRARGTTEAVLAEVQQYVTTAPAAPVPPLALSVNTVPSAPVAPECFPPCSPGYLCHEGSCIQACNPPCDAGFRCNAGRVCEVSGASALANPGGIGGVCVVRRLGPVNKWTVDLDGGRVGVVGSNRHLCFASDAGRRNVRVVQVIGGTGWLTDSLPNAPTPEAAMNIEVQPGEQVGILCDAVVGPLATRIDCWTLSDADLIGYLANTPAE